MAFIETLFVFQLIAFCKQLKMKSSDSKIYLIDCLTEKGIELLVSILLLKNRLAIQDWINGKSNSLDEQSKQRTYELFDKTKTYYMI